MGLVDRRHALDFCAGALRRSRCVVRQRQSKPDFCATRSCFATVCRRWRLLYCPVFLVLALSFVYAMSRLEELDEKLENASGNSEIFPEFHLTAHQIPSYQTGLALFIFSFTECVKKG